MSFRKYASAVPMGTLQFSNGKLTKVASMHSTATDGSREDSESIYLSEGTKHIDVQASINAVADKLKLSKNIEDYDFEIVKAVKSGGFNNNFDGFPRDEQHRYLLKHAKVSYRTFESKPHHLNHKVDVPGDARGFILDASYNDLSVPMDNCPSCNAATRQASERSSDGMHCKKCGHIVKSEFVECLLAIDRSKDPTFASHVRNGTLNATSMGCSCEETECNVCNNIARSAEEFCDHIRLSKGTWFKRSVQTLGTGKQAQQTIGPWSRSNIRELRAQLAVAGFNPRCAETTTRVVAGSTEFALAAEHCRYFSYDELSRVAKPAEPTALTIEFLELNRRAAETNALAFAKSAQEGKITMSKFFVVAVDGSHLDTHAAPSLKAAVLAAQPDANSKLAFVEVEAPDEDSARAMYLAHEKVAQSVPASAMPMAPQGPAVAPAVPPTGGAAPMQVDSSVTVEVPDGMNIQMVDQQGNPVTPPQDPSAMQDPGAAGDPMAPQAPAGGAAPDAVVPNQTPQSMGVMPPKSGSWAGRHAGFNVDVGEHFTIVANELDEPVFTVRHASSLTSDADVNAQATLVQSAVAQHGLLGAARLLKASFAIDAADATGIGDMKGAPSRISDTPPSQLDPVADPESDGLTDKQGEPVNVGSERDEPEVNIARDRIIAQHYEQAAQAVAAKNAAALDSAKSVGFSEGVDAVLRALKVVAKRATLNLEESQLKAAMFSALTTEREVGKTARGESVTTDPMPSDIAQFHIECAWAEAAEKEVIHQVERAAVLAKGGAEYLKTAEADLATQSVPMPRIAHVVDAVEVNSTSNSNNLAQNGQEVAHEVRGSLARMNFDGGRRTAFANNSSGGRANGRQ